MNEQNPNQAPNPYNPNPDPNGYAPNGYAQAPQQAYGQPPAQAYPPGWAPQPGYGQQPAPYGYHAPNFAPRHKLPGAAIFAGVVWVIFGALFLLGALAQLAGRPQPLSLMIGICLGIVFLMGGITTFTGKAKSLLGPAITAIVVGSLQLIAALLLGAAMGRFMGGMGGAVVLLIVLIGDLLMTSGIIGCITNRKYKEFHQTKHGGY